MSKEELLVLRKTLTDFFDKGWIRASASPASSPVLIAKKPGGGLRFCADYRGLNAITKKDRYPLPLICEALRQLAKAHWFTKVGVRKAFHRLRIEEEFIIEAGNGVNFDPDKINAIAEWEETENVTGIRSFLGFANFYRGSIPNLSAICEPLNSLTKKGAAWEWNENQPPVFKQLKQLLVSAPVLTMFDPDVETITEADSSGYAIGGVISQVDEKGQLGPVGFFSRKLTPAETIYKIYDKELLSIIATMRHFSGELRSVERPLIVFSDHRNLRYFMKTRQISERKVR
ncbi:hypothetical protein K3495_g1414 [Podosphaera aphanis]|nr:hypothetical protein K3495_g1414 [Podosphaera aphanis]